MRAVRIVGPGGPEVLEVVDVAEPRPGPGEILVRHAAVGVNFIDIYHRNGLYRTPLPTGIGLEAAGVVEVVGEGVSRFAIGDRVAYASGPIGAYAEAHVVKATQAVGLPDAIGFKTAAASLLRGMTAECLVQRCAPPEPGQTILVHAAAGGIGLILVQWAKALGIRVIGVAGSPAKAELARVHGCEAVIPSSDPDIAARVRELTDGHGVSVVYDGVGATTFDASLASLVPRGTLVSFGNASGPVAPVAPIRLAEAGSLFLTRPRLFDYIATVEELDASAAAYFAMLTSGAVTVEIGGEWPLEEADEAHRALEGRRTTGGLILTP